MSAPRLEIDLDKLQHNTRVLVGQLATHGISVTAVSKACLGSPDIANTFLKSGIQSIGDSRIENIETMRHAGIECSITLIRSPMLSQAERVVKNADISFNTEQDVISKLSSVAQQSGQTHGMVLMVELGDLREGIMPDDMESMVRKTLSFPNIKLKGIGTNLACRCGVAPDASNMSQLSRLAEDLESTFSQSFDIVSGGNSANLDWALSETDTGRINELRLGESLLLGHETLHRQPIPGLHTDAIVLFAEVIEIKTKPSQPWGRLAQNAYGETPVFTDQGNVSQAILAIGRQDIDPQGLTPPPDINIIDASSDHLIVQSTQNDLVVGTELAFQLNYSALTRAMTSPFISKESIGSG